MKILQDGSVQIQNKNTGQVKVVSPEDLPSYGIPYTQYATELKAAKSTGIDTVSTINETSPQLEQKKQDAKKVKQDMIDTAQELQNVIANKKQYSPDAYQNAINALSSSLIAKKKEAENYGASLTGNELAIMTGQVPRIQMREQNALDKITGNVPPQTGKVLDDEKTLQLKTKLLIAGLKGEKITPEMLNEVSNTQGEDKSIDGLLNNAGYNFTDILNSVLNIPKEMVDRTKESINNPSDTINKQYGSDNLGNILFGAQKSGLTEANQVLGEPLKGGDVVSRIINRAYEKPVTTALDLLPFLGLKKTVSNPTTDVAISTAENNPLKQIIRKTADVTKGGGSKEYISRTANSDTAIPQNQVLMEEGILKPLTETEKITKTSQSLDKYGSQIGDIYKNSNVTMTGDELSSVIDNGLKNSGYDTKAISFIKRYIGDRGEFDISSGDTNISQEQAWKIARSLEKTPPKMIKNPESANAYKQLSLDTAKIIRDTLSKNNPEVVPLNARYSALRDYMDNVLKDPQGISAQGGIINNISKGLKVGTDSGLNYLYGLLNSKN